MTILFVATGIAAFLALAVRFPKHAGNAPKAVEPR